MKTILCIDDDGWVLDTLKNALENRGFRVLVTTSAQVAPPSLKFEPIDLVLLDLNMPDQDGIELYRALQASRPVPVLFVTGCSRSFNERAAELRNPGAAGCGCFDVLSKPFMLEKLYAKVDAILQMPVPQ